MIIFIIPKNSGLSICREIAERYSGELIELRGEDIPLMVSNLVRQKKKVIGITGEDLFIEYLLRTKDKSLEIKKTKVWKDRNCLFEKPTLCLLGPKDKNFEDMPKKLKICINSKYKELSKKYCTNLLENKWYQIEKVYASGATEEFFSKKIVDLVIDIVCSGKSTDLAGLKVYDKLFSSDINNIL